MEMTLTELVRAFGPGEFHPFCIYDEHLDTIRVLVEDCSWFERMVGANLSLDERNYYPGRSFVGFNIEGAKSLCETNGMPFIRSMQVIPVLQLVSRVQPLTSLAIQDIAIPMVMEFELDRVEFLTDE